MAERRGILICGHGSRDVDAVDEFAGLVERLRPRWPDSPVAYGYLEFAKPVLRDGLDALRRQGVERVLAVPGMLFAAGHAKNDIPSVLNTYASSHPGMRIDYGRDLGIDSKMIRASGDRVDEAIRSSERETDVHDTLLLVVGRGASDPDANSNVSKVTRLLWEGKGFAWAETAYSGVTFPLVAPALERAAKLGFPRIIVFPYFLFTGILVQRIYDAVDAAARNHPEIEFIKAPYLNDHPLVIDTFVERVEQIVAGENHMNCSLCKYRTQILGFEAEVGLPQRSHHHHVEGIGTGATSATHRHAQPHVHHAHHAGHRHHDSDHNHGHDHHHDDHHHPYPHADHPLGPSSMLGKGKTRRGS